MMLKRNLILFFFLAMAFTAGCQESAVESYTSESMGISLQYPDSWVVDDSQPQLLTVTSEEGVDMNDPGDEAVIVILASSVSNLREAEPLQMINAFMSVPGILSSEESRVIEEPESIEHNGHQAATTTIEGQQGEETLRIKLTLITDEERMVAAFAAANADQAEQYAATMQEIVDSIEWEPSTQTSPTPNSPG